MAKNRAREPDLEPTSDEEESGSESESESESEVESERTPEAAPAPSVQQSLPRDHVQSEGSDAGPESEESSDEEAPSPPEPAAIVENATSKKKGNAIVPSQSSISSEPSTPSSKLIGSKRAADSKDVSHKDSKKVRRKLDTAPESEKRNGSKKPSFQRVWNGDDEEVVLRGILEYSDTKKLDPYTDIASFHEFIKEKLQANVNKDQLRTKIRRLKDKFTLNKNKEVDGEDRVFSKPHEQTAYELSKQIWGKTNMETAVRSSISKLPKQTKPIKENGFLEHSNGVIPENGNVAVKTGADDGPVRKNIPNLSNDSGRSAADMEGMVQRIGEWIFEGEKVVEGSKQWKNLKLREMEAYYQTLQVKFARTKLVIDTLKSSNA